MQGFAPPQSNVKLPFASAPPSPGAPARPASTGATDAAPGWTSQAIGCTRRGRAPCSRCSGVDDVASGKDARTRRVRRHRAAARRSEELAVVVVQWSITSFVEDQAQSGRAGCRARCPVATASIQVADLVAPRDMRRRPPRSSPAASTRARLVHPQRPDRRSRSRARAARTTRGGAPGSGRPSGRTSTRWTSCAPAATRCVGLPDRLPLRRDRRPPSAGQRAAESASAASTATTTTTAAVAPSRAS